MNAYTDAMQATSTEDSPWYVIPADKKWFTRLAVATIIRETLQEMNLRFPELSPKQRAELQKAKQVLLNE
jgi:hypothetical protein